MKTPFLLLAFSIATLVPAFGQGASTARTVDSEFVKQQFGNQFTLMPGVAPVFGDLDGDGVEDVVIAARCKNPLLDRGAQLRGDGSLLRFLWFWRSEGDNHV